jgi:hypothetical protein
MKTMGKVVIWLIWKWVKWFEKWIIKIDYDSHLSGKKEDYNLLEDAFVKLLALGLVVTAFVVLFLPVIIR